MNNKKPFGEFKPIGNFDPNNENKAIFIAMLVIIIVALILIIKSAV